MKGVKAAGKGIKGAAEAAKKPPVLGAVARNPGKSTALGLAGYGLGSNLLGGEEEEVITEEVIPKDDPDDDPDEWLYIRFKKNVEKRDLINEVKKREHYIKSSTRNKLAKEIAKKREKRRQEDQNLNRSA